MKKIDALSKLMGGRLVDDAGYRPQAVGTSHMQGASVIELGRIVPDPNQPRKTFDEDELNHLAESLKDVGQLEPVRVRYDAAADRYVIIAGERRYRAAHRAGLPTLLAIVDDRDLSADRLTVMQLIENALRVDLAPLEAAAAYRTLMEAWGCNQAELSKRLNISTAKVSRSLSLLDLPAESRQGIASGNLAPREALKAQPKRPRKKSKPAAKSVRLRCPAGSAVITLAEGSSVVDVLVALLEQERRQAAA